MKTFKLIAAVLFCMGLPGLQAQQSVLSASNNATGNAGQVSYSVGQVAFITTAGAEGTVTEGVQQPYEILFMDGIGDETGIALNCTLSPNPATGYVKLTIKNPALSDPGYQLSNMNGVLLRTMKVVEDETVIPMDDLAPATYLLTVFGNGKALQTYKIIKK
ncbi:MAG: T9SS type A sorting domain-containing protein [Bacteroidetes bacterium]|nr:T9SS type A sorting domain-containing protein [Bacteroidota bacterium]